jgi:hypothetical protein
MDTTAQEAGVRIALGYRRIFFGDDVNAGALPNSFDWLGLEFGAGRAQAYL